jgi:CRISPR-associated endonuclease/helicase Cas3
MNTAQSPYQTFWGKARRCEDGEIGWHPIAYHSLDVAAVGSVLLRDHHILSVETAFHPLFLTLLAWHDIGKFTRPFQCKVEALWPPVLGEFAHAADTHGHDTAGYMLLTNPLEQDVTQLLMPGWRNAGRAMLRAVCGHHGRPPSEVEALSVEYACDACLRAARIFAVEAMQVVGGQPIASPGTAVALRLAWQPPVWQWPPIGSPRMRRGSQPIMTPCRWSNIGARTRCRRHSRLWRRPGSCRRARGAA